MSERRLLCAALLAACSLAPLAAADSLFFVEAQAIAGYSFSGREWIFHSHHELEAMQKPSLGFDYLQRFSGASRDVALLALQARLALDAGEETRAELQVYNAFLKFKTRLFDLWIGHNRPHFGLAARLDQHALLLQSLAMSGFGFDRDWGVGLERDARGGDVGLSLTSGSGMSLRLRGNWLLSARLSRGVLERDNLNVGLSLAAGEVLDVMGSRLLSSEPIPVRMAGLDLTWLRDNWENRVEIALADRHAGPTAALLWRAGLGLLDEGRLKLEAQPALLREHGRFALEFSGGATYRIDADWTLRAMYRTGGHGDRGSRLVFQVYFYKGL
jgi:hypothetical protein